jgi:putative hydrolase of the HAD superfamily
MRPEPRAVIFDLDDTLYPYRRFALSGFAAVARYLADRAGIDARLAFRTMATASRGLDRGRELQVCLDRHGLPAGWLPEVLDQLRHHTPRLSLPPVTFRALRSLRAAGWRLGILTNGQYSIQRAKVSALGVEPLVDVVGYAMTIGAGGGKPDPDAFAWMANRLGVRAPRTVVVGDSERCDVSGADAAGMVPVRCTAWVGDRQTPTRARLTIDRLTVLPARVHTLIAEVGSRHAA